MIEPYYADDKCQLYLGKMEEVLPALGRTFDACVTDPPYGETSLKWDRWPNGWPALVADVTSSMWCFGSMRMFLDRIGDFNKPGWKLSQDVIWEKPVGTSMAADRFKRVHEFALHWYRGQWRDVHHEAQRESYHGEDRGVRHRAADRGEHFGSIRARTYEDVGTRLTKSILRVDNLHGRAVHPTEKPAGILTPLLSYAVPRGGVRPRHVRGLWLDARCSEGHRPACGGHRGRRTLRRGRRETVVPGRARLRGGRLMTAAPVVGRVVTPGHPRAYSTLRNARAAEFRAATRESRPRREPEPCTDCQGWHLAGTNDTATTEGAHRG